MYGYMCGRGSWVEVVCARRKLREIAASHVGCEEATVPQHQLCILHINTRKNFQTPFHGIYSNLLINALLLPTPPLLHPFHDPPLGLLNPPLLLSDRLCLLFPTQQRLKSTFGPLSITKCLLPPLPKTCLFAKMFLVLLLLIRIAEGCQFLQSGKLIELLVVGEQDVARGQAEGGW